MKSVLVYSTEGGGFCSGCKNPLGQCSCRAGIPAPRADGVVRVSRETKGRKGKGVTLVSGVPLNEQALAALAKELKQRCGSGGTVKDGTIEIQGDHRDRLVEEMQRRGYRVKKSGG